MEPSNRVTVSRLLCSESRPGCKYLGLVTNNLFFRNYKTEYHVVLSTKPSIFTCTDMVQKGRNSPLISVTREMSFRPCAVEPLLPV